jgi:hypothetical protein
MLSMINPDTLSRYDQTNHGHSTKVSLDQRYDDQTMKDNRIHTIHHKTQNNFFN